MKYLYSSLRLFSFNFILIALFSKGIFAQNSNSLLVTKPVFITNQQYSDKISGTISRPGSSQFFDSTASGAWNHTLNYTYFYDIAGNLIETISTNASSGQNVAKRTMSDTLLCTYSWVNNNWQLIDGTRYINNYDANDNIIEERMQTFISGNWINNWKETFAYNHLGQKIEMVFFTWVNANWNPVQKTVPVYVNGLITEEVEYAFDNSLSNWNENTRKVYSGWNKPNQAPISYISQFKDSQLQWRNLSKTDFTYDQYGGSVSETDIWNNNNNNWADMSKHTMLINSNGHQYRNFIEEYKNGTWHLSFSLQAQLIYNSNNELIEETVRMTPALNAPMLNLGKYIYSNFQQFNIAGVSNSSPKELNLNIYPNPTSDFLTLDLPQIEALQVSVSDLTGKTVLNQKFTSTENKQLNLHNLNSGIYLLHLETKSGKSIRKFVKN